MRLGVLATKEPYQQHTKPIWDALGAAEQERYCTTVPQARGADPTLWLTASARDFLAMHGPRVLMEHGTGLQFYPLRELKLIAKAAALAVPNEYVADLYRSTVTRNTRIEVVGTPKMDALYRIPDLGARTVAVSFHWSDHTAPQRYAEALRRLALGVRVIGHAHPRIWPMAQRFYGDLGIEPVESFAEVVVRADVYVADHSSTIYEWVALGRPVVLLNRCGARVPNGSGLRYDAFADVGTEATPQTLGAAVSTALDGDAAHKAAREEATAALYPHLGEATGRVVDLLRSV